MYVVFDLAAFSTSTFSVKRSDFSINDLDLKLFLHENSEQCQVFFCILYKRVENHVCLIAETSLLRLFP